MPGTVVIGAGPGIGQSVAQRFAREGLPVTLIARTRKTVDTVAAALAPTGVPILGLTADSTDEAALRAALDESTARHGLPDVVVYNPALIQADTLDSVSVSDQREAWSVNVLGALTAAAHIAPAMARRGSGTFIVTGGMPQPHPGYVSLSLGKAGVRSLVSLLDLEFGAAGVHVASVTVNGHVARGSAFDPDDIAEQYWLLHSQPRHAWQQEIIFEGTARPSVPA